MANEEEGSPVKNEPGTAAGRETLKEAKNDPAAQQALKKENQPSKPEDLSRLHDNHEVGTSGGDQRARDHAEGNHGS